MVSLEVYIMFKQLLLPLALLTIFTIAPAYAQGSPQIEIVLDQTVAAQGTTITAHILVTNAVNVAGADIGIEVGDCLQIIGRNQGQFLPNASNGGFTIFSQISDHKTRLAVALLDQSKVTSTDGVFYRVEMEVVCDAGSADIQITAGELSAYQNNGPNRTLVAYNTSNNTLGTTSEQVTIDPSAPLAVTFSHIATAQAHLNNESGWLLMFLGMVTLWIITQRKPNAVPKNTPTRSNDL